MKLKYLFALLVPALLWWPGESKAAGPLNQAEGIGPLIGSLLQKHAYLVAPEHRAALEEHNRQFRQWQSRQRRRGPIESGPSAEAQAKATDEAVALLERAVPAVRASWRDGKIIWAKEGGASLPADFGAVLFRIEAEGRGVRCLAIEHSLAEPEHAAVPLGLGQEPAGVTWVLLSLSEAPKQKVHLRLRFTANERTHLAVFPISTPPRGRLKLTTLDPDSGKPGPAMVRLIYKLNGEDRKPSNAIEFAPQMDGQGQPSGRRNSLYFGRLRGPFWCVPGPFEMELPAGEWEVTVRRGIEHLPVYENILIKPGEVTEKVCAPKRWVDMRKFGWHSGDDHVHCQILSDDEAARLMAWVVAEDIHLANVVKMGDVYRTWFEQRGWGKEHRVSSGDYILSPGQECPRTHSELGHTLHMNITNMVRDTDKYFLYDLVFDQVQAQGGFSGYAHVLNDAFFVHRDMALNVPKGVVDFAEIMQFANLGTDLYYSFLNSGFKLIASAGSDVPWGGTIGEVRVYAYLGSEPFSADAWFKAFGRGRTFVSNGPMLEFRVEEAYPGDTIQCAEDRPLRLRARAWGHPERVNLKKLEVVVHGKAAQTVEGNPSELSLELTLPSGHGWWAAARVQGSQGEWAHSGPIYVVRDGFRFWDIDQADRLIEQGLKSLQEIEDLVAEAKRQAGEQTEDFARAQLAKQSVALMERVSAGRGLYESLKKTAAEERRLRKTR